MEGLLANTRVLYNCVVDRIDRTGKDGAPVVIHTNEGNSYQGGCVLVFPDRALRIMMQGKSQLTYRQFDTAPPSHLCFRAAADAVVVTVPLGVLKKGTIRQATYGS